MRAKAREFKKGVWYSEFPTNKDNVKELFLKFEKEENGFLYFSDQSAKIYHKDKNGLIDFINTTPFYEDEKFNASQKLGNGFYVLGDPSKNDVNNYVSLKDGKALFLWKIGEFGEMAVRSAEHLKELYPEIRQISKKEFESFAKSLGSLFMNFY